MSVDDRPLPERDGPQKFTDKEVLRTQRVNRAFTLRIAGFSYRQIADDLGMDVKDTHVLVKRALSETQDVNRELIAEERKLDLARLDRIINRCWVHAFPQDQSAKPDESAMRTIMRALERRGKILGLEAPQKHQVDLGHLNGQVAIIVEYLTRVIPDESVPKVYEAIEEAMTVIERRDRALGREEVA